jgi:hypothetical protein
MWTLVNVQKRWSGIGSNQSFLFQPTGHDLCSAEFSRANLIWLCHWRQMQPTRFHIRPAPNQCDRENGPADAKIQVKTLTLTSDFDPNLFGLYICSCRFRGTQTVLSADCFSCPYNHSEIQCWSSLISYSFWTVSWSNQHLKLTLGIQSSQCTTALKNAKHSVLAKRTG